MADRLEETKDKLDRQFLGRGGIHSVGLRRSKQAVTVYMSPDAPGDRDQTLNEVRKQAAPFEVIVIEDEPAVAQPAPHR